MTGFEPRGVGSDRSLNCATTTAQVLRLLFGHGDVTRKIDGKFV